jgi:cardiolipin synthase
MNIEAWERYLDRLTNEPRVPAAVRLRIGGEQFFPDFIQAIQDARESIDIQLYIFDTDDYAIQIADLLKQRSREVRVRILIDEAASLQSSLQKPISPQPPGHRAPSSIIEYLRRDSKIRVRPMTMPALSANHTKMIIIDGRRAWLGGMNIGREYRSDWHDMMIEVTGPIIGWMQRSFVRTWAHNSWAGDLGELVTRFRSSREAAARIPIPAGAIPVRPLRSSALHSDLNDAQFAAVRNAQHSIWLENAYISYSRFVRELVNARRRGVDVRVILPAETDSKIMEGNNRALLPQLLRNGIRVWLVPGMSHIKAAIYDGWACIGSANFDRLSFRVNHEFNIGYSDPATVETLRRELFLKDMARGAEIKAPPPGSIGSQFTDGLLQVLAGQF